MIRSLSLSGLLLMLGCAAPAGNRLPGLVPEGRGQYVRPEYMNPTPTPRIPPVDQCRSRLYQGLIGRHEGAITFAHIPGRKRILKPAFPEGFDYQRDDSFYQEPPLIEVRDFIPDQSLYAPEIRTVTDRFLLGPEQQDRLTIELDAQGTVQYIRCE